MSFVETDKVEFKEKFTESIAKEIEAFLNSDGGVIYVGVTDDGKIIGVKNLDESLRKISDVISDQIEPNAIDCVIIQVIFEDNKPVIKLCIKKSYGELYCIKKYGYSANGCHLRVGTTCKSMSLEMIKRKFESSILSRDLMLRAPSFLGNLTFTKIKILLSESGYHINDDYFEKNLKLRNEDGRYNYLAELLADTNSVPFIFAKFKGLTKASYAERIDYGCQCVILAYEKMRDRLSIENICKTITYPRPRKDIFLFDMDAVNEALVNAVVHNDYRITNPQVSCFNDRLEILSHGGLPNGLSEEQFFDGESKPRNVQLMEVFVMLGIVEHTGHGVPLIVSKYGREAFNISGNSIRVVIPYNKDVLNAYRETNSQLIDESHELSMEKENSTGKSDSDKELVLSVLRNHPDYTARELSEALSKPMRTIQRVITQLKAEGRVERIGARKNGYWRINTGEDK